jgi:hypothetical protein
MHAPSLRLIRNTLLAVTLAALLAPERSRADPFVTVNPGVTLSYTFGRGFMYGFELSVVMLPETETREQFWRRPFGVGVAVDLSSNFDDLFKMRVGGEIIGPFIGIEAGPTLVVDRTGAHLGLGITPWAGWTVMPYYTYTWLPGETENLHEIGSYLKLYLAPNRDGGSGSFDDDWD